MGLLERAAALEDLKRWLGNARGGHGRLVLVEGEAGVRRLRAMGARNVARGPQTTGRWPGSKYPRTTSVPGKASG